MYKKITAILFLALAFFVLGSESNSQTIYFCEGVDDNGYPITESDVFNISRDGGYLYVLVRLPYEVACRSVRFELYKDGNYDNTIYLDTEKNWTWFWKKITFYKSGRFTVYAYDCFDYMLVSGSVRIQFR
ncbi:MAG: hypothetical protein L0Y79_05260 [Chlorobi bacterium]|nr:hypothetical protein [Chlorobiota bacterium]MCI0715026.1 hypothetical protein [Chlorobiota bacterium]